MLSKVKQFIPNVLLLAKKRQYKILVQGYDTENNDLVRYKTKILIGTQNFSLSPKQFLLFLLLLNLLFLLTLICLLLLSKTFIVASKIFSQELKTGQCGVTDSLHLK